MELKHTATRCGRLSSFLKSEMGMSTGLVNRLKWQNKILVNGVSRHNDFTVQPGDEITAILDDSAPEYPAEEGKLTVLYEDEHILAVDKPSGMLIHPSHSCNTGTLANRVLWYFRSKGEDAVFHPLTRLDRDTFGVVLLAKNAHISHLLQQGKIEKHYRAITYGGPESDAGEINAPIARKPLPSLLREIRGDGKTSITEYRVLERNGMLCKLDLQPITGRTHQLRLHCSHMGYPILGDPQYGSEESIAYSQDVGMETQQLCAKELRFTHPISGDALHICSKLDVDYPNSAQSR